MKTVAKFLVSLLFSFVAAFVSWIFLPEPPPLPGYFMRTFEPVVMFMAEDDVHDAEELLSYWEVWCYVIVFLVFVWLFYRIVRRKMGINTLTGNSNKPPSTSA